MRGLVVVSILLLACAVLGARRANNKPKTFTRPIIADQLRDYPGMCFASTKCATIEPGQSWDLSPYCGQSTCAVADDGRLIEVVEDCGPLPIENPKCKLNEEKTNRTAPFPNCCPVYECEDGAELEYPEVPTEPPSTKRRKASRSRNRDL